MNNATTMYIGSNQTGFNESYTAKEFAFISHNLGRKAETAITADRKKFAWDKAACKWVRYA